MNKLGVKKLEVNKSFNKSMIVPIIFLLALQGCAVYPNKFKCTDARGLPCTMLREVDRQIDSGQIAEIDRVKKCRGKTCPSSPGAGLVLKEKDKAEFPGGGPDESEIDEILGDGDKLYF